jgi:hypothetical protein
VSRPIGDPEGGFPSLNHQHYKISLFIFDIKDVS